MVTCNLPYHSPEVEYLVDGENGVVLKADISAAEYGDRVDLPERPRRPGATVSRSAIVRSAAHRRGDGRSLRSRDSDRTGGCEVSVERQTLQRWVSLTAHDAGIPAAPAIDGMLAVEHG